jgi:hypothetical protein
MNRKLVGRLERAAAAIEDRIIGPTAICAARRAWRERGELTASPKLREIVLDIDACLAAARASLQAPPNT